MAARDNGCISSDTLPDVAAERRNILKNVCRAQNAGMDRINVIDRQIADVRSSCEAQIASLMAQRAAAVSLNRTFSP